MFIEYWVQRLEETLKYKHKDTRKQNIYAFFQSTIVDINVIVKMVFISQENQWTLNMLLERHDTHFKIVFLLWVKGTE
jgi:hypothetical protein